MRLQDDRTYAHGMTAPQKILALAPVLRKRREHKLHSTPENRQLLRRFASGLKAARRKKGLDRRELADKVGSSMSAITHLELAENWPTLPVYLAICRELGLDVPPLLK